MEVWLDFHRATSKTECAGLSAKQLGRQAVAPSPLSLRGLLRHLTEVERYWFAEVFSGHESADLHCTGDDPD
ncbi:MAG: DinB family protein, partial [Micrococcaceae bacterium]|nr:DinB family protein [Micrococcaceae bacterium]